MGKFTLKPLEENDPVFSRGPVSYNPFAIRDALQARIAAETRSRCPRRLHRAVSRPAI